MPIVEASGRVEFAQGGGTGLGGNDADFDVVVPADLSNSAIVFMADWWGNATLNVNSATVDTGTVVQIGNTVGATNAREGGWSGRIMQPVSGTRTIMLGWNSGFGTGSAHLKTIAFWVLSGVDQDNPVNAIRDWIARASQAGNIADSVTTTVDGCSIFRSCNDFEGPNNDQSTIAGYVRVADAFEFSSAFSLEDAGAAGVKSSTYNPAQGNNRSTIVDQIFAIAPAADTGRTITGTHSLPAPAQAATVTVLATATAVHSLPAPTQSADVGVIGKVAGAHALPAPTQTADVALLGKVAAVHALPTPVQTAAARAIVKTTAAHALPAPVQSATARAIAKASGAHALPAPTQSASLSASDVRTITAAHTLLAPTQSATVRAIAKVAAAHALPAPAQTAAFKVIAKANAAHALPAPTQSALLSAAITRSIAAAHVLPAPTQAALVRAIAKANAAHALPAPTQAAALDVIDVPKITAAHRLPAPTMAASLAVISKVAANHALPAPRQSAFVRTGERQAIALVGSLPGSINLQGSKPAISLTGEIIQQGIALSGSIQT